MSDKEISRAAREAFDQARAAGADLNDAEICAIERAGELAEATGRTGFFDQQTLTWTSDEIA